MKEKKKKQVRREEGTEEGRKDRCKEGRKG